MISNGFPILQCQLELKTYCHVITFIFDRVKFTQYYFSKSTCILSASHLDLSSRVKDQGLKLIVIIVIMATNITDPRFPHRPYSVIFVVHVKERRTLKYTFFKTISDRISPFLLDYNGRDGSENNKQDM